MLDCSPTIVVTGPSSPTALVVTCPSSSPSAKVVGCSSPSIKVVTGRGGYHDSPTTVVTVPPACACVCAASTAFVSSPLGCTCSPTSVVMTCSSPRASVVIAAFSSPAIPLAAIPSVALSSALSFAISQLLQR